MDSEGTSNPFKLHELVAKEMRESLSKSDKGLRAGFDLSFSICVKPLDGDLYCGLFVENKELHNAIISSLNLSAFFTGTTQMRQRAYPKKNGLKDSESGQT